jgi:hypothetical protein
LPQRNWIARLSKLGGAGRLRRFMDFAEDFFLPESTENNIKLIKESSLYQCVDERVKCCFRENIAEIDYVRTNISTFTLG